jgi:hypothetical protein
VTIVSYDVEGVSAWSGGWHRTSDDDGGAPQSMPERSWVEAVIGEARTPTRRRALWQERGIRLPADVGWDVNRRAWVLLIRDHEGCVVNVEWRPARGQMMRWKGTDVDRPKRLLNRRAHTGHLPLYPSVPRGDLWMLVAGTWDVHSARQAGVPEAVTGLLGCQWNDAWNDHVAGKRVAVVYDVGELEAAHVTVQRLENAGAAEAWVVDLGLPRIRDDVERALRPKHYGGYGWTGNELKHLMNAAYHAAREEQ